VRQLPKYAQTIERAVRSLRLARRIKNGRVRAGLSAPDPVRIVRVRAMAARPSMSKASHGVVSVSN
jgi:hypothetical protein